MKTVYYSITVDTPLNGAYFHIPKLGENINNVLKQKFKDTPESMHGWLLCPATTQSLKNTFEIKNTLPFDFQFKEDGTLEVFSDGKGASKFRDEWVKSVWFLRSIKDKFASLNYNIYFFCEEDLQLEQHHPWYSDGEFAANTYQTVGGFNISKWLRPFQITFIGKNNNKVSVKKDEPLCYVKFLTEEKIKFVQFEMTEKLYRISADCTNVKFLDPWRTLNYLYKKFTSLNFQKTVIKEIKNNLV
jgi:hypothetical protein